MLGALLILLLPSLAHTTSDRESPNLSRKLVDFPLVKPQPDPNQFGAAAKAYEALRAAEKAKHDAEVKAQAERAYTASQSVPAVSYGGSHTDWMAQAGIAASDYGYVDYIISRESGWSPVAQNASSGAAGLPQALPYSKTGCAWGDPICQIRWANSYAVSRYGSWYNAYVFWSQSHWW